MVTNLLEALNIWSEALMHGIPVDMIYLDYAKAFDSVPHQRLLRQVKSHGITVMDPGISPEPTPEGLRQR